MITDRATLIARLRSSEAFDRLEQIAMRTAVADMLEADARLLTDARDTLKDCAIEIVDWCEDRYGATKHRPDEKLRYDLDIELATIARELVTRIESVLNPEPPHE